VSYGKQTTRTTSIAWHPTLRLPTQIAEPLKITTMTYDTAGRVLTRAVNAEGLPPPQEEGGGGVQHDTYDTSGHLIETTQPDGAKLYYDYDAAGRLIRLRDDEGNRIDYTYDFMSHKRAEIVYDPQGNLCRISRRVVDPFGTLTQQINADNSETAYTYDPAGNLTAETDPLNRKAQ
jgi:YD repeat-containing protein